MKPAILATTIAALLAAAPTHADTRTWDGGASPDNSLLDAQNWLGDAAPISDLVNTDLIFAGTTNLFPNLNVPFSANSVTFDNTAGAFILTGAPLTIGTGGMVNESSLNQTFNNQVNVGAGGTIFDSANGNLSFAGFVNLGANSASVLGAFNTNFTDFIGNGSLLKHGTATMHYAPTAVAPLRLDLEIHSGFVVQDAAVTYSSEGSIAIFAGNYTANADITLDGGRLTTSTEFAFFLDAGATLRAQNGGTAAFTGFYVLRNSAATEVDGAGSTLSATDHLVIRSGGTLTVAQGGSVTSGGGLYVGGEGGGIQGDGTVIVDGVGSSLAFAVPSTWGFLEQTGTVIVRNHATLAGAGVVLGGTLLSAGNGVFRVESGADATLTGDILVAPDDITSSGRITVTGAGSTLVSMGSGNLTLGGPATSSAEMIVSDGGTFTSGLGTALVNATGVIRVDTGGTYRAEGDIVVSGGSFRVEGVGIFDLLAGRNVTVQPGGTLLRGGEFSINTLHAAANNNIVVTGAGSTLSASFARIDGASQLSVLDGATFSAVAFNVGIGSSGSVGIVGAGSSASFALPGIWATSGGTASVTLSDGATVTGAGLTLGGGTTAGTSGSIFIEDTSSLTLTGDLRVAADGGTVAGAISLSSVGATLTLSNPASALVVGGPVGTVGSITMSGGTLISHAAVSINPGGGITLANGGAFDLRADLTLDAGFLNGLSSPGFTITPGHTITARNEASISFSGVVTLEDTVFNLDNSSVQGADETRVFGGSTVNVSNAGNFTTGVLDVGTAGTGAVFVDGVTSSLVQGSFSPNPSRFGAGAGHGSVTLRNGADGSFPTVSIAAGGHSGGSGTLSIESGAVLSLTNLYAGTSGATSTAAVNISGPGSRLEVVGDSQVVIGAGSSSVATLNVNTGAAFEVFDGGGGSVMLNASGTIRVSGGSVTLADPITVAGVIHVTSGSFTAENLALQPTGALTLDGGSVTITDSLTRNGGVIAFDAGALAIPIGFNVGTGGLFGSSLTLDSDQELTTTGVTTIDAGRTLTLDGGTLRTEELRAIGTFDFRRGTLAITGVAGYTIGGGFGSSLTVHPGTSLEIINSVTVSPGASLTVAGGNLTAGSLFNQGSTRLNAGALTVAGALTNQSGSQLFVSDILTTGGAFLNPGRITLRDGTGQLAGGGSLTNHGLLTGDGIVSMQIQNSYSGELRAENGKTLIFDGVVAPNLGRINLQGGTIEFDRELTNASSGVIQGRGTMHFAGGLVNEGVMNLSAGTTDVFGAVELTGGTSGGDVIVSGGVTATFYDNFRHNGDEVRASGGSRIVFFGDVTGAGDFTGTGDLQFEGTFSPGNSPAIINVAPRVTLTDTSILVLEIGGILPGPNHPGLLDGYDQINFTSASTPQVTWDGTLRIDFINGFTPQLGDVFNLLDFDPVRDAGAFDQILVTRDGVPAADFGFDYGVLYDTGVITVNAVPEPSAAALLIFGSLLLSRRWRRR